LDPNRHRRFRAIVLALTLASASAFVSPAPVRAATAASVAVFPEIDPVRVNEGAMPPVGFFDPWGLSVDASPETLGWYRAAELKHGRVCMAAFVGFLVQSAGLHFPGAIYMDGTQFADLPADPAAAWAALSDAGRYQIIGFLGFLEFHSELAKPHVMRGGNPGEIRPMLKNLGGGKLWDPLGNVASMSPAKKAIGRTKELANGRAAMLGMAGVLAAYNIPGSVPMQFLPGQ